MYFQALEIDIFCIAPHSYHTSVTIIPEHSDSQGIVNFLYQSKESNLVYLLD